MSTQISVIKHEMIHSLGQTCVKANQGQIDDEELEKPKETVGGAEKNQGFKGSSSHVMEQGEYLLHDSLEFPV